MSCWDGGKGIVIAADELCGIALTKISRCTFFAYSG